MSAYQRLTRLLGMHDPPHLDEPEAIAIPADAIPGLAFAAIMSAPTPLDAIRMGDRIVSACVEAVADLDATHACDDDGLDLVDAAGAADLHDLYNQPAYGQNGWQ